MSTSRSLSQIAGALDGKKVAVVGGFLTLLDPESLKDFDLVFWVNNHHTRLPDSPCDGLFHCCGPKVPAADALTTANAKDWRLFVGASWAKEFPEFHAHCVKYSIPCLGYGKTPALSWIYEDLSQRCQAVGCAEPLTGLIAAHFLHHFGCEEIHLLGMNLYNSLEWTPGICQHNPNGHAILFRELMAVDERIKPCSSLYLAVNGPLKPASPADSTEAI